MCHIHNARMMMTLMQFKNNFFRLLFLSSRTVFSFLSGVYIYVIAWGLLGQDSGDTLGPNSFSDLAVSSSSHNLVGHIFSLNESLLETHIGNLRVMLCKLELIEIRAKNFSDLANVRFKSILSRT